MEIDYIDTMKYVLLFLSVSFFQDITFKPKEEFDIQLDYKFKQRPSADLSSSVNLNETKAEYERRTSTDLLPFLTLHVKMIKLSNEVKLKVTNNMNSRIFNRKVAEGTVVPIELGFTADVKDRVSPHEYVLTFMSPEKSEVSRILIIVEEDGTFLVNGEKRGKF